MALPIENFDSYTNGDALNGLNGGSNWNGAWSASAAVGEATISNAQSVSSPNSLQFYRISTECSANRVFGSSETSGTIEFYVRREAVSPDIIVFQWRSGGTDVFRLDFNKDGNIVAYRSGGTTTLQTYTNNTWYKVQIEFDCSSDEYIVTINNGTPSSALAFQNAVASIDRFLLNISANGFGTPGKNWIDSIGSSISAFTVSTSDQLNITESVGLTVVSAISVSDQLNITESVTALVTFLLISVSDQINLTESVTNSGQLYISTNDNITISENIAFDGQSLSIDVYDSISISESVEMFMNPLVISIYDQLTITENFLIICTEQKKGLAILRSKSQEYPLTMDR